MWDFSSLNFMSTKKQNKRIDIRRARHREKDVQCEVPRGKMLGKIVQRGYGAVIVDKDEKPNYRQEEKD